MSFEVDIHTHTISSGHAYSTLDEMVEAASKRGLKVVATTDHAPRMPGGPHIYHFHNLRVIPDYLYGVRVLKGVEANIINYNGKIDMPDALLDELDFVIASFHFPCLKPANEKKCTKAILNLMDNRRVSVIGHPEDLRYKFNIREVVQKSRETGVLLELNNSSLKSTSYRIGSKEGIIKILEECAREGVEIAVGSDSHHSSSVGLFYEANSIIDETGFPKELIINRSAKVFCKHFGVKFNKSNI